MMAEGSSGNLSGLSVVEKKVGQDEVGTPRSSMAGEDFVLVGEESPDGPRKVLNSEISSKAEENPLSPAAQVLRLEVPQTKGPAPIMRSAEKPETFDSDAESVDEWEKTSHPGTPLPRLVSGQMSPFNDVPRSPESLRSLDDDGLSSDGEDTYHPSYGTESHGAPAEEESGEALKARMQQQLDELAAQLAEKERQLENVTAQHSWAIENLVSSSEAEREALAKELMAVSEERDAVVNELKHSEDQFSALVGQVMDQKLQLLEAKLTAAITPPLSPGRVTAVQTPEGGMGALNAAMSLPAGLPVAPGIESEQARHEQAVLGAMGRPSAPHLPPSSVTSVDWRKSAVVRTPTTCLYPRSAATQTPVPPAPAMNKIEVIWKQVMIQGRRAACASRRGLIKAVKVGNVGLRIAAHHTKNGLQIAGCHSRTGLEIARVHGGRAALAVRHHAVSIWDAVRRSDFSWMDAYFLGCGLLCCHMILQGLARGSHAHTGAQQIQQKPRRSRSRAKKARGSPATSRESSSESRWTASSTESPADFVERVLDAIAEMPFPERALPHHRGYCADDAPRVRKRTHVLGGSELAEYEKFLADSKPRVTEVLPEVVPEFVAPLVVEPEVVVVEREKKAVRHGKVAAPKPTKQAQKEHAEELPAWERQVVPKKLLEKLPFSFRKHLSAPSPFFIEIPQDLRP